MLFSLYLNNSAILIHGNMHTNSCVAMTIYDVSEITVTVSGRGEVFWSGVSSVDKNGKASHMRTGRIRQYWNSENYMDVKQVIYDKGSSISINKQVRYDKGSSISINKQVIYEKGSSISINKQVIYEKGSSISINKQVIYDKGSSISINKYLCGIRAYLIDTGCIQMCSLNYATFLDSSNITNESWDNYRKCIDL